MKKRRFLKILFGSPDRIMTSISLIVGILSFVFSICSTYYPNIPQILIVRDILVVLVFILFVAILSVKYYKKDGLVILTKRNMRQQIRASHDIVHKFRNHSFVELRNGLLDVGNGSRSIDDVCEKYFKRVSHSVLTDVRSVFVQYFKSRGLDIMDDLSVTLKMIIRSEEAQAMLEQLHGEEADQLNKKKRFLITAFRDPVTWEKQPERKEVKKLIFSIDDGNTAFDHIINKTNDYYLSNDLSSEKGYRNQTRNWQDRYNSVLVAPIRCKQGNDKKSTTTYGLICVDSKNPEKHDLFDEEMALHMLAQAADCLALMFMNIEIVKKVIPTETEVKNVA
jgi:hypothetical protein